MNAALFGDVPLYIDGAHSVATSGEWFETRNPATQDVLANVQHANHADVDRAVQSALRGFAVWSAMTGAERGRILQRAAAILRDRNAELAHLEVLDTGKPISEAIAVDVANWIVSSMMSKCDFF